MSLLASSSVVLWPCKTRKEESVMAFSPAFSPHRRRCSCSARRNCRTLTFLGRECPWRTDIWSWFYSLHFLKIWNPNQTAKNLQNFWGTFELWTTVRYFKKYFDEEIWLNYLREIFTKFLNKSSEKFSLCIADVLALCN